LNREGPRHDAILSLEAARENGDIVTARKAVTWLTVEVKGKAAHAGVEPEKGASATAALGHIIEKTYALNDFDGGLSVNPGDVAGGRAPNIVADYARGRFDLRAWTNSELQKLKTAFVDIANREYIPGVTVTVS